MQSPFIRTLFSRIGDIKAWMTRRASLLVTLVLVAVIAACGGSSADGLTTTPRPTGGVVGAGFIATDPNVKPSGTAVFTLQVLHASDFEAGVSAALPVPADAIRFSAVLSGLRPTFPNTLTLSSGDNYLPGPFYNASSDTTLASKYGNAPGKADIEIMNALGIQASTMGNHEFDQGPNQVATLIRRVASANYAGTLFPYISSNLTFNPDANITANDVAADGQEVTSALANKLTKSAFITVGGERIGIVGVTTANLGGISSPGANIVVGGAGSSATAADQVPASVIQPAIDALTAQGINKIILLAHLQQVENEVQLASQLRNVDIVIAGGSHRVFSKASDRLRNEDQNPSTAPTGGRTGDYPVLRTNASGNPIAIVNTRANYTYVGRLIVGFDAAGTVVNIDPLSGAYATDDQGVSAVSGATPIQAVVTAVQPIATLITQKDSAPFYGSSTIFLNGLRQDVRSRETNWGNLTADANLAFARTIDSSTVISLKNGGGIRAPLGSSSGGGGGTPVSFLPPAANPSTGKQAGQISQLDIESSLAFNNTLSLVTVTATQLKQIMEHGVAQSAPGATPGRFPQVGGLAFSFDPSRTAQTDVAADGTFTPGQRIRSLAIKNAQGQTTDVVVRDGAIVGDPNRTFRLVTLNFLVNSSSATNPNIGGDSYPFPSFPNLSRRDLIAAGTTSATFSTVGSEQAAAAAFLQSAGSITAQTYPDLPNTQSTRIQNLSARNDTVL